jgi:TatD DNase family protein
MFVDTHCHMNMMVGKKFDEMLRSEHFARIVQVIERAKASGVGKIITVGTSLAETKNVVAIAQKHENVWATAGIHPCDCTQFWQDDFNHIKKLVQDKQEHKIVAIGETGLDFFHKPFDKQRQIDAFKAHIELSLEYQLPLVIHIRDSVDEVLYVLEPYQRQARGVFHCFMQEKYVADLAITWGWFIGINGPITYPKNEWFRTLVSQIKLDHVLLETDAPFLPPQQMRGKQNSPEYIPLIAQVVADLHGVSLQVVEEKTTMNATKLFRLR